MRSHAETTMLNSVDKKEKAALAKDVREMNHFLRINGKSEEMRALGKPSLMQTFLSISLDWALVFLSVFLVYFHSLLWLPVALLVIGSRQRALVVLTHDASHFLLAKNHYFNDVIANIFLCFPMLKSLKYYRAVHLPHHINLGDEKADTDYLHDPEAMKGGWINVYLKYLLSYDLWVIAALKQTFKKISHRHMILLSVWWGTVLCGLSALVSTSYACTFFALWFISRAVMYHIITTFIIISDHHGLFPGTILEYTRNHPSSGFVRWFIHPHNNGFHLAHHLVPFVPFYNLGRARTLLQGWGRYDNAEQCETYFIGEKSVIRSWGKSVALTRHDTQADIKITENAVQYARPAFEALKAVIKEAAITPTEQNTGRVVDSRHIA